MREIDTAFAKELRANATPAERRLWYWLRQRPLGYKFRRQVPLGPYIVDFACYEARLIIEIDGQFHAHQEADVTRERQLRAFGWRIVRYWNRDVRLNLDGVLADIEQHLATRH
jgi:very-short-patch-repair endonuclease